MAESKITVVYDDKTEVFSLTLSHVLQFTTGASEQPPLGFDPQPATAFQEVSPLPNANTCINTIFLPTVHTEYEDFKYHVVFGIANAAGFSVVLLLPVLHVYFCVQNEMNVITHLLLDHYVMPNCKSAYAKLALGKKFGLEAANKPLK